VIRATDGGEDGLAAPGRAAPSCRFRPGIPVGVSYGRPRRSSEFSLPPGAVVGLYSDGLVERGCCLAYRHQGGWVGVDAVDAGRGMARIVTGTRATRARVARGGVHSILRVLPVRHGDS